MIGYTENFKKDMYKEIKAMTKKTTGNLMADFQIEQAELQMIKKTKAIKDEIDELKHVIDLLYDIVNDERIRDARFTDGQVFGKHQIADINHTTQRMNEITNKVNKDFEQLKWQTEIRRVVAFTCGQSFIEI